MGEGQINCSVTVMPVYEGKIGFVKRRKGDTYPELLVAPGGKVESTDGEIIDGVPYYSVEAAAVREMKEETNLELTPNNLMYFCSLTLPNGRVVISMWVELEDADFMLAKNLTFLTPDEVAARHDFAPGMRTEALMLARDQFGWGI